MEKMGGISEAKQKELGINNTVLVPSPLAINIYVKNNTLLESDYYIATFPALALHCTMMGNFF